MPHLLSELVVVAVPTAVPNVDYQVIDNLDGTGPQLNWLSTTITKPTQEQLDAAAAYLDSHPVPGPPDFDGLITTLALSGVDLHCQAAQFEYGILNPILLSRDSKNIPYILHWFEAVKTALAKANNPLTSAEIATINAALTANNFGIQVSS
jgi:hypothetical protein